MPKSSAKLRTLWKKFECAEADMVVAPFGPDRIRVAPVTTAAWESLAAVMLHHGYDIRTIDTDSYNCRTIKSSGAKSLHSYGIALDVNWTTNPYLNHAGSRGPRFSKKLSQAERAEDVRLGQADTDMTKAMIKDVLAIRTKGGVQVLEWGGNWKNLKDAMHFELDVSPAELAKGIDETTVKGLDAMVASAAPPLAATAAAIPAVVGEPHVVVARNGLRLRGGPSKDFDIIGKMAAGATIFITSRIGDWAQIDLEGDGLVDGFAHTGFLRASPAGPSMLAAPAPSAPATAPVAATAAVAVPADGLANLTVDTVKPMFPVTRRSNIETNLPFVLAGLRGLDLADRPMALMALATIRAETEGFVPISEGRSRFNTVTTPFDKYDAGTSIGARIGNTVPGDGPRFRGRGYVQLTGRDNYTRIGGQIGVDLADNQDLANDPETAGRILAQFLKNNEAAIRTALATDDLREARRRVNGGSHGLDRFKDAFRRGEASIPV